MKPRDIAIAVAVTAVWGINFVAISTGLDHFPPLLFNALRFTAAAFPALLFAGRPQVPWRWVVATGFTLGVVKFSLLFAGVAAGMPAGVALVGSRMTTNLGAFLLIVGAAATWGLANIVTRTAAPPDTLRFIVWVSAVASLPLIVLTLIVDGPAADLAALRAIDLEAIAALLYIALLSTLAGFAGWGFLLKRYGATTVAPFSMLVPFFGMASAPCSSASRSTRWTSPAGCSWWAASCSAWCDRRRA